MERLYYLIYSQVNDNRWVVVYEEWDILIIFQKMDEILKTFTDGSGKGLERYGNGGVFAIFDKPDMVTGYCYRKQYVRELLDLDWDYTGFDEDFDPNGHIPKHSEHVTEKKPDKENAVGTDLMPNTLTLNSVWEYALRCIKGGGYAYNAYWGLKLELRDKVIWSQWDNGTEYPNEYVDEEWYPNIWKDCSDWSCSWPDSVKSPTEQDKENPLGTAKNTAVLSPGANVADYVKALDWLKSGKSVRRKWWGKETSVSFVGNILTIAVGIENHPLDGTMFMFTDEDKVANDWVFLP